MYDKLEDQFKIKVNDFVNFLLADNNFKWDKCGKDQMGTERIKRPKLLPDGKYDCTDIKTKLKERNTRYASNSMVKKMFPLHDIFQLIHGNIDFIHSMFRSLRNEKKMVKIYKEIQDKAKFKMEDLFTVHMQ